MSGEGMEISKNILRIGVAAMIVGAGKGVYDQFAGRFDLARAVITSPHSPAEIENANDVLKDAMYEAGNLMRQKRRPELPRIPLNTDAAADILNAEEAVNTQRGRMADALRDPLLRQDGVIAVGGVVLTFLAGGTILVRRVRRP